ncbi:Retrovirus-related Pol polyprotein from transposon RE1 [Vitis vinifera]|uniref:Retrovirus-related Pol polyprotein from transposon RE1 n=1 Tax=Vitis vinifera TaxID=29760 RepID=A0A438F073_VITVI|nr:Retrovirus-related Pol polyprotein from transposon RE1 [Vitis vinifera]
MITSEKLVGSENYLSWSTSVELWFMGQGYEDHLITQEADIPEAKGLYTNDIQRLYKVASAIVHLSQQDLDLSTYIGQIASLKEQFLTVMPLTPDIGAQQTHLDKFFMVLTLIGLRPDLEPIRDQILGSSSVPSLDDVFARLLRISSTQTLPSDSASDFFCVSFSNYLSRRTQCYMEDLLALPIWPNPLILRCLQPPSSSASQTSQASIASVAQPGNASACLTHTSSLGPWILDSGASDHLSGNKDLFSSITTTSDLPTVTLANGSQTVAKGIGLALPLPSLPLTSVLYTPECPFNLISISKITRTLNCSITFSDKFVTLQDRSTGKTIGIGRESQGLYHLTSDSSPAVCISTDAPLLIHNRLGHPSLSKFQKMVPRFFHFVVASVFLTPFFFPDQPLYFLPPRVFGCTCFVHILTPGQDKLSAKAMKCLFLGYSRLQKGYRCYSLETHRYFISADVYHRRPRVVAPLPFPEAPADSLPIPSASPAPALPSPNDLPIAVRKGWRQAMVDEMLRLVPDGQVDRLKARLVAKGYTQVYGSDYGDTFSPVAKIASVRLLLSMAAMCSWPLYQLDIKNAFLHGDLAEEVLYGATSWFCCSGGVWFSVQVTPLSIWLETISSSMCIYLVVYVDDIVITGSDQDGIQKLKQHLFTHFQTKDLGKLKYFLGIEIAQSSSGVVLSQRKYALDILEETGMLDCKPVDTPMDPNVKLVPGQGEPLGVPGRYRRLVGKLNYLTITRPDISFPYTRPKVYCTRTEVILKLLVTTDADWAGSPTDRRSTSGYCVFIGGNLISWKSKKQDVVARSSAEAEYRAMALATCELIWLRHLLQELRFGKDEQMKLICDNQAALHIASNPVFHERTKHIEVDCHFIREKIASGCVATSFVNSNDQLADIFTKSLRVSASDMEVLRGPIMASQIVMVIQNITRPKKANNLNPGWSYDSAPSYAANSIGRRGSHNNDGGAGCGSHGGGTVIRATIVMASIIVVAAGGMKTNDSDDNSSSCNGVLSKRLDTELISKLFEVLVHVAANTTSTGRGAKDDQYSYFTPATSA